MSNPAISGDSAGAKSVSAGKAGTAGATLLGERRRQGLSVGDISRQLKLSVRQVEALERDDYSGYKGPVFVHGFIRNYAKLLGLDPEPLIRAADSMLNPPQVAEPLPQEPRRRPSASATPSKFRFRPAVWAALLLIIALSVYFAGRHSPEAPRAAPTVASHEKSVASTKMPAGSGVETERKVRAEARPVAEAAQKSAAKPGAKPATEKTETTAGTQDDSVHAGAAIAAESGTRVTVRMVFEQDSWVEIKDRNGNTIFGQLNAAGSRRSVSGEPPLSVVVGNAAGVHLFQGDKSVDLGPHTRVDVARLTLE